ncbi:MAG: tripartite tricarboxylate transporter substrate binding protein [Pseudomonadota bacterium]
MALSAVSAGVAAAETYPAHPTRFVVGGGPDQLARIVADKLSTEWPQPVFVEQKNGAGGTVAAQFIAASAPDGYNWLLSSTTYTIGTALNPKLPYNFSKDLAPVTMIATLPFVLVVNNDLPVKSLQELVALAKAQPGKLNYASSGTGAPPHLAGEMLKQMAGIDVLHVPYKFVSPALADVMANQAQYMFAPAPAALALVKAGKLRAIAVSTLERYSHLPDVPTVAELGYPDYQLVGWNGVHVAARTPAVILDKIAADVAAVMNTPEARQKAENAGFVPSAMTRKEFEAFCAADLARFAKVIKAGNIKAD